MTQFNENGTLESQDYGENLYRRLELGLH